MLFSFLAVEREENTTVCDLAMSPEAEDRDAERKGKSDLKIAQTLQHYSKKSGEGTYSTKLFSKC